MKTQRDCQRNSKKGCIEESWVFQKEGAIAWLVIAKTTMSQQDTLVSE